MSSIVQLQPRLTRNVASASSLDTPIACITWLTFLSQPVQALPRPIRRVPALLGCPSAPAPSGTAAPPRTPLASAATSRHGQGRWTRGVTPRGLCLRTYQQPGKHLRTQRFEDRTLAVSVIANETDDPQLAQRFLALCESFLGVAPAWAGQVPRDPQVARSVAHQKPLSEAASPAPAWVAIKRLTRDLQRSGKAARDREQSIMPSSRSTDRAR